MRLAARGGAADSVVGTTTTSAAGAYTFKTYTPGRYYLRLAPTSVLQLPSSSAGGDNGVDGDNNGTQPSGIGGLVVSPMIELKAGEEPGISGSTNVENTIDFGIRGCPHSRHRTEHLGECTALSRLCSDADGYWRSGTPTRGHWCRAVCQQVCHWCRQVPALRRLLARQVQRACWPRTISTLKPATHRAAQSSARAGDHGVVSDGGD